MKKKIMTLLIAVLAIGLTTTAFAIPGSILFEDFCAQEPNNFDPQVNSYNPTTKFFICDAGIYEMKDNITDHEDRITNLESDFILEGFEAIHLSSVGPGGDLDFTVSFGTAGFPGYDLSAVDIEFYGLGVDTRYDSDATFTHTEEPQILRNGGQINIVLLENYDDGGLLVTDETILCTWLGNESFDSCRNLTVDVSDGTRTYSLEYDVISLGDEPADVDWVSYPFKTITRFHLANP